MIAKVYKPYRGIGGASYSTPAGPPQPNTDGGFTVYFINPDGTGTRWYNVFGTSWTDGHFVSPPADVWASLGVQLVQQQNDLAAQQAAANAIGAASGPVLTYNQAMANEAIQQAAAAKTTTAVTTGGTKVPSFSFTSSGGNAAQLKVGDTWTVTITGAAPGTGVSIAGSKNNVSFGTILAPNPGRTDGSGNYTASAQVGTFDIGNYIEIWQVGGVGVGSITFSVVPVPTTPPSQAPSGSIVPPQNTTPPASNPTQVFDLFGDSSNPISIGSFQIGAYTALGLGAALIVGLMVMSKGR